MEHTNNYKRTLQNYVSHRLSEEEEFEVQEHLINCDECSEFVHQLRLISQKNQQLHEEWVKKEEEITRLKKFLNAIVVIYNQYQRELAIAASLLLLIGVGYYSFTWGEGSAKSEWEAKLTKAKSEWEEKSDIIIAENRANWKDSIQKSQQNQSTTNENIIVSATPPPSPEIYDTMDNNAEVSIILGKDQGPAGHNSNGISPLKDSVNINNTVFWKNSKIKFVNKSTKKIDVWIYANKIKDNKLEIFSNFSLPADSITSITADKPGLFYYQFKYQAYPIKGGKIWVWER